ncbi:MAG: PQQ-binding-like beta-propeller repeat protein [Deltaproteobacteria bacterium]|nr:PQQ-binding-like beta-propeller repeat protein [Deltaproteobacteria bacterium]
MLNAVALLALACTTPDELGVPLSPDSPWPKFRQNARQNGRSPVKPSMTGGALWEFPTGKGIFSTPVVGGDGTVYVGSADRTFYAISYDGRLRWKLLTGEIIDSSALLDDKGRVYFGSGDGRLYARDAQTGEEVWTFDADPPSANRALINWFEGNVAMGPDGTLYVPNDNFFLYGIDRDSGRAKWKLRLKDQTWSLPAVDPRSGNLFVGNNALLEIIGGNTFAVDPKGNVLWEKKSDGSVAASPLLTKDGKVVVGGFDGFVRAYDQRSGIRLWSFGTRDHIYSSPAELANGTLVQPSADGTIYGLDPKSGALRWSFDTLEAIRSSPAVDGDGNIYVGSGEGRLFVLRQDGTLRWAMRLIDGERNDLNASPALGRESIYIAGESGQVFSVPYDYCLRPEGRADSRCTVGPGEDLPADGAHILYTTQLGAPLVDPPSEIDAHETMAFSLFVREAGNTKLALVDSASAKVTIEPAVPARVEVSGDRRFVTIVPLAPLGAGEGGTVSVRLEGQYLVELERVGLYFEGGTVGGRFGKTFTFKLRPPPMDAFTIRVPTEPGDPATQWEFNRLALPLPSILPSYNQIGFDSLHYLVGVVEGSPERFVTWLVGAKLAEGENRTIVDPATRALFPLEGTYRDGLLSLTNEAGFAVEVMNASLTFSQFRMTARLRPDGESVGSARLFASSICSRLSFYGPFLNLLGFCNTQTGVLAAFGAALLREHRGAPSLPPGIGEVTFEATADQVTARISNSSIKLEEHAIGLLLIDAASGRPVSLDYGPETQRHANEGGVLTSVTIQLPKGKAEGLVRVYLMIDTLPAARGELEVPRRR